MTDDELKKFAFCDGDPECPCGPCSLLRDCHEVRAEVRGLSEDYKELSRLRKAEAVDNLATQNRLTRLLDGLEDTLEHHNRAGRVKALVIQALIKEANTSTEQSGSQSEECKPDPTHM